MLTLSSRMNISAKPHLKVPQVWLPEEGAHDVEVGRRLDDGRLPPQRPPPQQRRQEQTAAGRRRREARQPPSLMRLRIMWYLN